jgi:hypothetical protein
MGKKLRRVWSPELVNIISTIDILMIILIVPPGSLDSSLEKQHDQIISALPEFSSKHIDKRRRNW